MSAPQAGAPRWVVKIGSALLADGENSLHAGRIGELAAAVMQVRRCGFEVALVSSGAIAAGLMPMGFRKRPEEMAKLQALAAVGQGRLIAAWEKAFAAHGASIAQMLLCRDDVSDPTRRANARATLDSLFELRAQPIINQNDSVSDEEIRFGDNDTLAALVADLIEAEQLVLLTDQRGFCEADPRKRPGARLIERAAVDDPLLERAASDGGSLGRGGMVSKLRAARMVAARGASTAIVNGLDSSALLALAEGGSPGTLLHPPAALSPA